jgi:hypothetical protein
MSRTLADAVADGLHAELLALDEAATEKNAEPFIKYMRDRANGYLEMEYGEDGNNPSEVIVDAFQSDLESDISDATLRKAAQNVLGNEEGDPDLSNVDEAALEEILKDPALFDFRREDQYGRRRDDGSVWSYNIGTVEDQHDGAKHDEELHAILFGGEHRGTRYARGGPDGGVPYSVSYPGLSQVALDYALKELENDEPYISVNDHGRRKEITVEDLEKSFYTTISKYEGDYLVAYYNEDKLKAALADLLNEPAPKLGPENDDVVYKYAGTNDSVGGASARGMYVARLKPKDLRREGATQGICIGREENGHPKALREGRTQVFSIRTEAGKPKFTIELARMAVTEMYPEMEEPWAFRKDDLKEVLGKPALAGLRWGIAEVKGKANRQPGFEAGKDKFTKPDDLRLVTDFLLSLGYSPEAITAASDVKPGVKAMLETGVSPFEAPPRRVRPHRDPRQIAPAENPARSSPLSAAVRKALAATRPMGTFRL